METRIAVIAIIVEDRSKSEELNQLLHAYGEYVVGRLGVPYREKGYLSSVLSWMRRRKRSVLCQESWGCSGDYQ